VDVAERLAVVDPTRFPGWDDLLLSHPDTSVFHTSAWARALSQTYAYLPLYFTLIENDQLVGLLPFMEIRSWITGKRGVSLPFTDESAPILPDGIGFEEGMAQVIALAESRGWRTIEIRGRVPGMGNLPVSAEYLSHDLDLTGGEETLFSRYRPNVHRNIRKAEREGISVSEDATPNGLMEFYRLNCLTRREHGLPPQPVRFFENLRRHVLEEGHGFLVLARREKKAVAGALFLLFSGKAVFKYGASDRRYQELRANNLVFRDAIRLLCRRGARTLSFGRTDFGQEGLRQFKLSWGTTETRLQYFKYDMRSKTYLTADQSLWENRLKKTFANLPLPVLRIIGNIAYRHAG
jgi:Acetyltransferase (GNAT) domain